MVSLCNSLLLSLLLIFMAAECIRADVIVSGSVFCDQCKDGRRSFFDYPLYGVQVALVCEDGDGKARVWNEETTNWFGAYSMRLPGNPDLSRCFAQVASNQQETASWCAASTGPARSVSLYYNQSDVAYYTVDSLLTQPAEPLSFCPQRTNPSPTPVVALPPLPLMRQSACSYRHWTMPENRCNWRVVGPDTEVAIAFGLAAAQKYGTDMTLMQALHGKGEIYRTLLREATTALLNSYNSLQFEYPTLSVVWYMNSALMGSPSEALVQAARFRRANLGSANVTCHMTKCK